MADVVPDSRTTSTVPDDAVFAERYRAISARDVRFDGQFFTAVRTTGIYCRPSCPARTPRPRNVTFYLTSAAAHDAGFRACKRCLPEATPGTPEWNLRRDLAGRAMRLMADGVVDREGVAGLANRLGYSARQVNRLLVAELGAGALALARARRAATARALLAGTSMKLADVAFAAGFGSIRQFNDTIAEVFGTAPSEIRRRATRGVHGSTETSRGTPHRTTGGARGTGHETGEAPRARRGTDASPRGQRGTGVSPHDDEPCPPDPTSADHYRQVLRLAMPVRLPFDARGVFEFLAVRAAAGVEVAELAGPDLRYGRTLQLPQGPAAFEVRHRPGSASVEVTLEVTHLSDVPVAVTRIRRLLDLDADPIAVDRALGQDPHMSAGVLAVPGIRVPGAVDAAELVIRAIVGQQISVAAARTHLTRLAAGAGTPYVSGIPGLNRLFPTSAQVAQHASDHLRLPARNLATIVATAQALAAGELTLSVGDDATDLRARLESRHGIGPWTAGYVALRVLGDPDVLLDGDVALLAGARRLGIIDPDTPRAAGFRRLATHGADWAPWRSYAAMHLWRAAG